MRMTLDEAVARYGAIVDGKWANEALFCVLMPIPDSIAETWINTASGLPTHHVYCNRDMAEALGKALSLTEERGLILQLKTFDGCLMIRDVRGHPGSPSCHSYGCAIDINAVTNRLGTPGDISDELAACFIENGFTWGKHFHRQDPMHFSLAWE